MNPNPDTFGEVFLELIKDSIILRGSIALTLVIGYVIMSINQIPINENYTLIVIAVVTYFYGAAQVRNMSTMLIKQQENSGVK